MEDENAQFTYMQLEETDDVVNVEGSSGWRKWRPDNLKRPLDKNLSDKINLVNENTNNDKSSDSPQASVMNQSIPQVNKAEQSNSCFNKENVKSRRRPVAALHGSEIGKIFTTLGKERLELAKVEGAILQNKLNADKIKQELEIEILRTQLAIEREKLEKIRQ